MTLHHLETVIRPRSVEEAWSERAKAGEEARFFAGGIDLVLFSPPTTHTLIDLSGLGLEEIRREGGGLVIGAMATLTAVLESPLTAECAGGFLPSVLRRVASPLQRNLATIGGAVARAHPWSDVVPALLALGAEVELYDGTARRADMEQYYETRSQGPAPLVTSIRIPNAGSGAAAFEKYGRTAFDVGALNCACYASGSAQRCDVVRVAIGGTPALARRLPETEALLHESGLVAETVAAAARRAAQEIDARDDRRSSAAYRRVLAEVATRRCLERVARDLEEQ